MFVGRAVKLILGRGTLATATVAAGVVLGSVVSGSVEASNLTMLFMGFDADRAQMITALLVACGTAAAATLAANHGLRATLAGVASFGLLFGRPFLIETRNAFNNPGIDRGFRPIGWLVTVLTLITVATMASWVGMVLARTLRPWLITTGSIVLTALRTRRPSRALARPGALAIAAILLVVTVPVFGDMVNYLPDSKMLHGAGYAEINLAVDDSRAPNQRPWLAWRPTGRGEVSSTELPVRPGDDSGTTDEVVVYTPPGYDPNGSRSYPTLYEVPFGYGLWDASINVRVALDAMISRGSIPAMIVVFVNTWRPPTNCNPLVCNYWMDSFIDRTVIAYVDSNYRTIPQPASRAIAGFSEGGYLAPTMALRHPDDFETAISISGFFTEGAGDASAWMPFGTESADIAASSPLLVAAQLPQAERARLFFVVVAQPSQAFFGPEATDFEQLLAASGYTYKALNANVGHGWDQVRQTLPLTLEAWADRMVVTGALTPPTDQGFESGA